jgi:hypothetical protein
MVVTYVKYLFGVIHYRDTTTHELYTANNILSTTADRELPVNW